MLKSQHRWACTVALSGLFIAACASITTAQKKPGLVDDALDILGELDSTKRQDDIASIGLSHLSRVSTWLGVRPAQVQPDDRAAYRWSVSNGFVSPLGPDAISTKIEVPKKAKYRIYLRHVLTHTKKRPVSMQLKSLASEEPSKSHTYGAITLADAENGKEQEGKLPVRFESELHLNTAAEAQMPVWEYWEVALEPGPYELTLHSSDPSVQVDALFITPSTAIRPSFSPLIKDNTLQKIYLRFRLVDQVNRPRTFGITASLTYHWRGRASRAGTELWGYPVGSAMDVSGAEWSPFIDATDAIVPGPGPWSTCRVNVPGVTTNQLEVQLAWYPHEAAAVHTLATQVGGGQAMFRVPHGLPQYRNAADKPRWGVWDVAQLDAFLPEEKLVERYFTWAKTAAEDLKIEKPQLCKKLLFLSGNGVGIPYRERASEMLASLGINWIENASPATVERLGLYESKDVTKVKLGDEIGTLTPASVINASPALLAGFHRYLQEQAKLQESTLPKLLGIENIDSIRCLAAMPENPGRHERWLYYHSHRYCHEATIPQYAKALREIQSKQKNALVYNNYSPHPVFLTGNSMNTSDWFLLPRAGAQTLGWAEDWAYPGSWSLGTDRGQCTSFYAALVDCSVRPRGYPAGFYVGTNTSDSATKIFSCVAQGIDIMHLYDWGPIDSWAEGSNSWSESQSEYKAILRATQALAPADEIIGSGQREQRRTAILYNRSHEIMNGNTVALNHDWMWAMFAMKSAQIPVDVIIEEDLNAKTLANYDVLYFGGLNLETRHLRAVSDWVQSGGWLIGTGGSARFDAYNNASAMTEELFGARQIATPRYQVKPDETVRFSKSDLFETAELKVASPNYRYTLEPKTAKPLAHYSTGEVACVTQAVGKGRTILYGFYPGLTFRDNGRALGTAQKWFTKPLLAKLGRQRVEFSFPASEATLFEHSQGVAITLANFSPPGLKLSAELSHLSVATDRKITEAVSALHGALVWKRVGDRIEIETTPPDKWIVDTVILR